MRARCAYQLHHNINHDINYMSSLKLSVRVASADSAFSRRGLVDGAKEAELTGFKLEASLDGSST